MAFDNLIGLAEDYFAAVDQMDLGRVLSMFHPDATFEIPTHGLIYRGRDGEIAGMFTRLFSRYKSVWHGEFDHFVEPPGKIASRFLVKNTSFEDTLSYKNNCNYFYLKENKFEKVYVYMAGENSLV
jgi:hypothetical protein